MKLYNLNWGNIGKKIPKNYNKLIIPEIEKVCKYINGDIVKNKIYNYIIYEYNKGNTEGILKSLNIFFNGKTKKIYYKITEKDIILTLKEVK